MCLATTQAQMITEKHINFSGKESLSLNIQIADSIKLHTWNKNEVFVTSSVNINDNKDNDAYSISFDESGKTVYVNAKFKDNYFKGRKNCCNESEINWHIYVPEKTAFSIETISGNIEIDGKTDKMKVKTISGYIDLAIPADRNADLDFSTISGTVYTNHDLTMDKTASSMPEVIKDRMNKGGTAIQLETISGDIFFRKAE
jgi:DUF4097 and DUF4098 domain-containing protein YvlB